MKNKFKLAVIQFSILILLNCSCSPGKNKTPNVLLITADDLGLYLSCYGDTLIQTPHIDGLAYEGIRLTNGYVSQASCSPSRSSIYTGSFPHQNGQMGLSHLGFAMFNNLPNIVSLLKQHGYRTGIIGKLHIQPEEDFPFDYNKTPAEPTRDVFNVANQAEEFLLSGDAPFFLAVNYFDPHVQFADQVKGIPGKPLGAKDVTMFDFQRIDTPSQRERIAGYYNGIKRLDAGVGMLIEKLQSLNLLDNTLIIFMGDHGAPFTRAKTSCYEAALKIPIIVRYPENIPENTVSSALVSTTDILPTVLDVCNIEFNHSCEGKSLVPLFDRPD
jgi:N-sulfoglucosamine sulfohydrolase